LHQQQNGINQLIAHFTFWCDGYAWLIIHVSCKTLLLYSSLHCLINQLLVLWGLVQKSYQARPQTVFLFHANSQISSTFCKAVKIMLVQAVCINVFVLLTGKYTSPVVIPNLPIVQISTDSYILRRVKVTI
jgi:hypothetical protein